MGKEYYRIKLESGKISISLFDKGNPIPHTSYKGNIKSQKTKDFIKEAYNRIADKQVKSFLASFIDFGESFSQQLKRDFE